MLHFVCHLLCRSITKNLISLVNNVLHVCLQVEALQARHARLLQSVAQAGLLRGDCEVLELQVGGECRHKQGGMRVVWKQAWGLGRSCRIMIALCLLSEASSTQRPRQNTRLGRGTSSHLYPLPYPYPLCSLVPIVPPLPPFASRLPWPMTSACPPLATSPMAVPEPPTLIPALLLLMPWITVLPGLSMGVQAGGQGRGWR